MHNIINILSHNLNKYSIFTCYFLLKTRTICVILMNRYTNYAAYFSKQKGFFMKLPNDPVMLLSAVNTQLRDHYNSLDALCAAGGYSKKEITEKLDSIGYRYDPKINQFV